MIKQVQYPNLFPEKGLSLADAIINILAGGQALKARAIAYRLNTYFGFQVMRKDVNSLLYGRLRNQVRKLEDYKWTLRSVTTKPSMKIIIEKASVEAPDMTLWSFIKLLLK